MFIINFFYNIKAIFFTYIKLSKGLSAKYCYDNLERLLNKTCERYQNLSGQEKVEMKQYGCEWFKNLALKMKNKN